MPSSKSCCSSAASGPDAIEILGTLLPATLSLLRTKEEKESGTSLTANDIYVIRDPKRIFQHDDKVKDRIVATAGFSNNVPFVSSGHGVHAQAQGHGISLYETRDNEYAFKYNLNQKNEQSRIIRYAIILFPFSDCMTKQYLVVRKGELFALERYFQRLEKRSSLKLPPVLEEGLLTRIVQNSVEFLINREEIEKYGVRLRRGIILDGPPGNGKTMVCKWLKSLCTQHNISQYSLTSGEMEKAYKDGNLSFYMNYAEILFLDDIDISFFSRKSNGDSKMACAMLSAMDGIDNGKHCVRIFTTNEAISDIDPAFKRPGRVDCVFYFKKPTPILRRRLVGLWPEEILKNIDINKLIASTNDFSFADVEEIRALLVTNKVVAGKGWDLEEALSAFRSRNETEKVEGRKGIGFKTQLESKDDAPEFTGVGA